MYIDGIEKLTKLPSLMRGSILTFETQVLTSNKVRVTIEVDEKIVTFDWVIDTSQNKKGMAAGLAMGETKDHSIDLYFAMKFTSDEWKVGVE